MKPKINIDKVAKALGAERRGTVTSGGGFFGAMQLLGEVQARFRAPTGGGRSTDPTWTERRLVPFAPETLARLGQLAADINAKTGVGVAPLQVAALLLEQAASAVDAAEAEELARARPSREGRDDAQKAVPLTAASGRTIELALESAANRLAEERFSLAYAFRQWCGGVLKFDAVAKALDCDRLPVLRLCLSFRPDASAKDFAVQVKAIALGVGVDAYRLTTLLREEASLAAFAGSKGKQLLAAARDERDPNGDK